MTGVQTCALPICLVSYYIGSTPDYYAKKNINYLDVEMSEYQTFIYKYYEEIEEKIKTSIKGFQRSVGLRGSNGFEMDASLE